MRRLTATLLALVLPFSFAMLVGLTGFEIMVSFLQAYIFTILAAVYIGSSLSADRSTRPWCTRWTPCSWSRTTPGST